MTSSAVRWDGDRVTFLTAGDIPKDYEIDGIGGVIRDAGAVWTRGSCSAVAIEYAGSASGAAQHGDGVNTISFVTSNWAGLSPSEAAATTDVIYEYRAASGWHIVEADIYLNAQDFTWSGGAWTQQSKDLFTVLQHELGHALGLLHPCERNGESGAPDCAKDDSFLSSVMYPEYQLAQLPLSNDDRAGLCFLYGCDPECQRATTCEGDSCVELCDGEPCTKPLCGPEGDCASSDCRGTPECTRPDRETTKCRSDAECATGLCEDGSCGSTQSSECDQDDCASLKPLGASCDHARECAGGQCLIGARPHSICTRSCGSNSACPRDWTCRNVMGSAVCAPADYAVSGGCALGHGTTRLGSFLTALALAMGGFRRVRRNIGRRRQ